MDADIGFGPGSQDQRLDIVELELDLVGTEAGGKFLENAHVNNPRPRVAR